MGFNFNFFILLGADTRSAPTRNLNLLIFILILIGQSENYLIS